MASIPLACTVRECGLLLERQRRAYTCARGHGFDVARNGYVNLLQPQDRRSLNAGDSAEAVAARARLIDAGVGVEVIAELVARAAALPTAPDPVAIDLGSGTGDLLGAFRRARRVSAAGLDLSTAAAAHAARRFPDVLWIVANADRRLPLLDATVDLVFSLHSRRAPAECARIVPRGGFLLIAAPAPSDLIELRQAVQGEAVARERAGTVIAEHEPWFDVVERGRVEATHTLARDALADLLRATYRGERHGVRRRLSALTMLEVTTASEVLVFKRRE